MALPRIPNYTIRTAYTPKNLFWVIRAKKEKKRERVTGGASEHIDISSSLMVCFISLTCIPSYASDSEASLNIFSLRGMGQKTPKHLHFSKGLEYWLF